MQDSTPVNNVKKRQIPFINLSLLPIKTHYFLIYGALGGVLPFLPIFIKTIGITAKSVGVIFTVFRFVSFFTKPAIGALADHFKNIRYVMISLIFFLVSSFTLLLFIPPIQRNTSDIIFQCLDDNTSVTVPVTHNQICMEQNPTQFLVCETNAHTYELGEREVDEGIPVVICDPNLSKTYLNLSLEINGDTGAPNFTDRNPLLCSSILVKTGGPIIFDICSKCSNRTTSITRSQNMDGFALFVQEFKTNYEYKTYQFWIVLILIVVGGICFTGIYSLSDAACFEILGDRSEDLGKQKMWEALGWGFSALLAGYLNDLQSARSLSVDHSSGFFFMTAMAVLDVVLLFSVMSVKMPAFSSKILKDVRRLFSSHEVKLFAMGVFAVGVFYGLCWTYEIWFLQSLGASQTVLGLSVTVQSLGGEVLFYFLSGRIIQKFGHFVCLSLTFLAFALRFILYSILINPWYVLPIELLQGWTFGVFVATMASFAKQSALTGTEATMQGLLGGLYEGLGFGVGSLLGGVGFEKIGGHHTFLWAGVTSFMCALIFSISRYALKVQNTAEISVTRMDRESTANATVIFKDTFLVLPNQEFSRQNNKEFGRHDQNQKLRIEI